ncbi:DUF4806 domain-containing protein [Camponotus japonicus]
MDTRVKKIIQKRPRKHINFILNTQRTGQSKRLGHPSRPIIRPKKYITTSSSDKEKSIKRIRTDKSNRSEQTTDIENHIDQIRKDLSNDKENEPDNAFTENASPAIFNTSSPQLLNPASQMESLPNVIYEQYSGSNNSMRQKTYTELLTRNSSSNFNSVPTTSFYESPQTQRHEAHHYQEEPSRLISTCERNNLDRSHVGYKLDQNQARCNLVQSQAEYNFGQSQTGSRSRDREVGCQYEKLNNVVSKEDFQFLREEMNKYYQTINEKLDKLLRKRINNIMPPKPSVFPLQSVQQVEDFNNISEEKYENAVEYLHFVGGFTLHDAIKHCMREAITDDAIQYYSAWGERGNRPLFETKIIKAIYDAVCRNAHFKKPLRDEFFREVGEAVRFGKQRNRNVMKRMNERERGQRQRLRREADNNLFGEVEDNTHNDNEIDDANDGDPESN